MNNGYAQAGVNRTPASGPYGETRSVIDTLDTVLAVARRGWNKARATLLANSSEHADSERLRDAFRVFTDAAARLEGAYAVLRGRVEQLSVELARANGELDRQLREKQVLVERQTALLAALPAGVLVIDAGGIVRDANAAAQTLLGVAPVGMPWQDVASRLAPAESEFEWLTGGELPRRVTMQNQVLDARGERIVLLHDVTDAHAARVRVERNERLASMGEMAARLAHQLRTPLATALLYASQLERVGLSDEERVQLGGRILSRLRSLERVTREMLRFVRGEQAPVHAIEVGALLTEAGEVIAPLMAARGIAFVCHDGTGGARLRGDRRGIAAALLSLLENAAQATGQGGKVRIDALANSMHIRIRVSDSGGGITAQALPKLFEPFYSTRADGTGLGLAIVKSVVEAHGGTVEVATSADAGSSFTVTLPCTCERGQADVPIAARTMTRTERLGQREAA